MSMSAIAANHQSKAIAHVQAQALDNLELCKWTEMTALSVLVSRGPHSQLLSSSEGNLEKCQSQIRNRLEFPRSFRTVEVDVRRTDTFVESRRQPAYPSLFTPQESKEWHGPNRLNASSACKATILNDTQDVFPRLSFKPTI
mmetsp:Transcript_43970/g.171740  ORF Transcript_43970/g.171740 Transcript_43970/m.171740 type:complete len:142 (-) Transcript_43970:958-1383(-)